MTPDKKITVAQLALLDFPAKEIKNLCGGTHAVLWTELAKYDGLAALLALSPDEYDRIKAELIAQGLPESVAAKPHGVIEAIVAFAHSHCPRGEWYDAGLVSAVACSTLIRLAQVSWGHDDAEAQRLESEAFAAKLTQGVH